MTAVLTNNGSGSMGIRGAEAFQQGAPNHQGGNQNNNKNTVRKYPVRSKTIEPRTTEFPKTTTPSDDRKSDMFSPMDPDDPRRRRKKKRQAQKKARSIWETSAPMLVEASSLHTVDFEEPSTERVQVLLKKSDMDTFSGNRKTTREPLIARVDLWHGPDSTPQNLAIYLEDDEDEDEDIPYHDDEDRFYAETNGSCDTPFTTIIETPYGHNTIAIRNIADDSDLLTYVKGEENENWYKPSAPKSHDSPLQSVVQRLKATTTPQRIDSTCARKTENNDDEEDNKAVVGSCTVELPSKIASVQVLLQTDFMQPIQARIELELRVEDDASRATPGEDYRVVKRTIVEVYSEDGMHRPFFAVLETPRKTKRRQGWFGNQKASYSTSMKVVNLSTTEFPLFATVEPHEIDDSFEEDDVEDDATSPEAPSEESQEWTHFGGGSNYDVSTNSTILDAEIL